MMKGKKLIALLLTTIIVLNLTLTNVGELGWNMLGLSEWELADLDMSWVTEVVAADEEDEEYDMDIELIDENQNVMSTSEYASFGFTDTLADVGEMIDEYADPLSGFEAVTPLELYVGTMNFTEHYKGSFTIFDDVDELSADSLSLVERTESGETIGDEVSYPDEVSKDEQEIQTKNTCALDWDGDGIDEIAEVTLYVDVTYDSKPKERSMLYVTVWAQNEDGDYVDAVEHKVIELVDTDSNDETFVWNLDADSSKGYASITSGDYDRDGLDEIAVYVPSTIDDSPYVLMLEPDADYKTLEEVGDKILLSELDREEDNNYGLTYHKEYLPIVDLYTTSISGDDDLVISASFPRIKNYDYNDESQLTAVGIYRWNGDGIIEGDETDTQGTKLEQEALFHPTGSETWDGDDGGNKFRFSSAVDTDLNGNGVGELLLGGYMNDELDENKGVGEINSEVNLIQLVVWGVKDEEAKSSTDTSPHALESSEETDTFVSDNEETYRMVWDNAVEVDALTDQGLYVDNIILEPAALTSGNYLGEDDSTEVFLEGVVFDYTGATEIEEGEYEGDCFATGEFENIYEMELDGKNSSFISTAESGIFSTESVETDQIVVLTGDHDDDAQSEVYYDICWLWTENGEITSVVSDNNYMYKKTLSQNGTSICLTPLNTDTDSVVFKYVGCNYGWSSPAILAILQNTPFWSEIPYVDDEGSRGSVTWAFSSESGSGTTTETVDTEGYSASASVKGELWKFALGVGGEFEYVESVIEENVSEYAESVEYEVSASAISGEDMVVLEMIPTATYYYAVYLPDQVVTQSDLDAAIEAFDIELESDESDLPDIGEILEGSWEEMAITTALPGIYTHMSLEEYNEAAEEYNEEHEEEGSTMLVIEEEMLPEKEVGDPTTYTSMEAAYEGYTYEYIRETSSVLIGNSESETAITSATLSGEEYSTGTAVEYSGGAGVIGGVEIWRIEAEVEVYDTAGAETSTINSVTSSEEVALTVTYTDIPPEVGIEEYEYEVKMVTGNIDLNDDPDVYEAGPLFVASVVSTPTEETAPPLLPEDLRISSQTETITALEWTNPDEESERYADYYQLYYLEDYNEATGSYTNAQPCTIFVDGEINEEGIVGSDATSCIVFNMNVDSAAFAFVAYQNEGLGDTEISQSVMGEPIVISAKNGNEPPVIETQPKDAEIVDGVATYTVTAKPGNVSNVDELEFTWQKYESSLSSNTGEWVDCDEDEVTIEVEQEGTSSYTATIEVEIEDEAENYRCLVTETTQTSISYTTTTNTVTAYESGEMEDALAVDMSLAITEIEATEDAEGNKSGVSELQGEYYISQGQDFTIELELDGTDVTAGDYVAFYANGQDSSEKLLGYVAIEDGVENYTLLVDVSEIDLDADRNEELLMSDTHDTYTLGAIYIDRTESTSEEGEYVTRLKSASSIRANIGQLDNSVNYYAINYSESYDMPENGVGTAAYYGDNPTLMTSYTADFELEDPTLAGYEFIDWTVSSVRYQDSLVGNVVSPSTLPIATDSTTDYDLVANFELIYYDIEYVLNQTVNEELEEVVADEETNEQLQDVLTNDVDNSANVETYSIVDNVITLEEPTCDGMVFLGWYTDENFSEDSQITSIQGTRCEDITLYAKWIEEVYTVNYWLAKGINALENPYTFTIFSGEVELELPALFENSFRGWFTDASYTTTDETIEEEATGDQTFHALWEAIAPTPDLEKVDGVYQISSLEDLETLAQFVWDRNKLFTDIECELTCNIDGEGADWTLPIGTTSKPFYGDFDGNNYVIYNLNMTSDYTTQGIFGSIAASGSVSNLRTVELTTDGNAYFAGGIAGENYGTIDNCYSGVYQITLNEIEALLDVSIDIGNSQITALIAAGGLVGINYGEITNSGNSSYVESVLVAGGLVGANSGTIENGYNVGTVIIDDENDMKADILAVLEEYIELDQDESDEDAIVDSDVVLEAFEEGIVGGIAGVNLDEGSMYNLYNAGVIDLRVINGGVVGLSETEAFEYCYYRESVLGEDIVAECANQDSATTISKSFSDMRDEKFAETLSLNTTGTNLSDWNDVLIRNGGFPMLEVKNLSFNSLVDEESGVTVTGEMHEDTELTVEELESSDEGYTVLITAAGDAEVEWIQEVSLTYNDGVEGLYGGDITIRIELPTIEDTSDLVLLHYAADGTVIEHANESTENGVFIATITSFSPFALVNTAEGETAVDDVNTGDDASIWLWIAIMGVAVLGCGGVLIYTRRKNKK